MTGLPASGARIEEHQHIDYAVSQSPAIFYIVSLERGYPLKFISSNFEKITGHKADNFIADPTYVRQFVHPDDFTPFKEMIPRLIAEGRLIHEYRFRGTNGEYRWYRDELRIAETGPAVGREYVGCMIDITAEVEAKEKLHESEGYFRLLVEANPLPVWLTDLETCEVLYASPAMSTMLGFGSTGGKPRCTIEHYVDDDARKTILEMIKRDGQVADFETLFKRADGSEFWVSINSRMIDYQGRAAGITGLIDLSDRKRRETDLSRAQNEMRKSEQLFRLLIERHPLPMILADLETGETWYESPAAIRSMGGERVAGEKYDVHNNYVDPEDRNRLIRRIRQQGEAYNVPIEYKRGDGSTFWASASSQIVVHNGREGLLTAMVDQTEQVEREEKLRQARENLSRSEELFRMLVEHHPLPVALVEVDSGKILYNSPAAAELTGRAWDSDGDYYAGDHYADPKARQRMVATLRRQGYLQNYPTQYKREDGSTYWISTNSKLIEWRGQELHIVSMIDLSEQHEREQALQRAHETLEDAIESLSEGFALFDADDRLVTYNSRYKDFNQICADILEPGLEFERLVRTGAERGKYMGGDRASVDDWLEKYKASRFATYGEGYEFEQADGRWVSYSNQPTRQGGMVVTLTDITARKEMERAIRESEESVRTILESSPVPLTMVRVDDGQIIYESPVAQTIFRYDASQGYGSTIERWVSPEEREAYLKHLRKVRAIDAMEVWRLRADGTTFRAALSSRLITYKGEEVIISSAYDLTERLAMEEEMARQRDALHQSEKMAALGELLASVAHELNNPLSVVVGQAMLLQETAADPDIATRAERIATAADRCARVVKAFLAMARQQPTESRPTDLNELIEASIEVTGYALRTAEVDVSIRLGRTLPAVRVDPDQMTQVITNLIVNAEHALRQVPAGRKLWISSRYRKKSDEVIVKIKDNGTGVSDDIPRRIFEPFFTTKEVGSGTGMGLAICHRILDSHGGKVKIETTPGGGATFVLRLPAMNGTGDGKTKDATEPAGPSDLSVLIIDDEPDVAELLRDILRGDGHRPVIAGNGEEALECLESGSFDVVLSDLRMPKMDGPALFRMLRWKHPDLLQRVAFITGDTLSGDIKQFLATAERPHIEKPITPRDVRDLVRRVAGDGKSESVGR